MIFYSNDPDGVAVTETREHFSMTCTDMGSCRGFARENGAFLLRQFAVISGVIGSASNNYGGSKRVNFF